jgi:hypothetical protein
MQWFSQYWDVVGETSRLQKCDNVVEKVKLYAKKNRYGVSMAGDSLGGYIAEILGGLHHIKFFSFNAPEINMEPKSLKLGDPEALRRSIDQGKGRVAKMATRVATRKNGYLFYPRV